MSVELVKGRMLISYRVLRLLICEYVAIISYRLDNNP